MTMFLPNDIINGEKYTRNRKRPHKFIENFLGTCEQCDLEKGAKIHKLFEMRKKLKKMI